MATSRPGMHECEGFHMSNHLVVHSLKKSLKEHINEVKQMEVRKDDIFVCAAPKCGTHWVWEIINVLLTGALQKKQKETAMVDMMPVKTTDALPSPRVLNTHFPPHLLPLAIPERKPKVIFVYRNPKDVAISSFYFYKQTPMAEDNIKDFINKFPKRKHPYNFFQYMREFTSFLKKYPDIPSLVLSYEGLSNDPHKHVKLIAALIGVKCSDETVAEVVEMCNFDNMKKADMTYKENYVDDLSKGSGKKFEMYRKGKVGDWKNYFTVAESEMFDEEIKRELVDTGIQYQFE